MNKPRASRENYYGYNIYLKLRGRELRKRMTRGERALWKMIRRKSLCEFSALRQRPVDVYVADFMIKELFLIIEVDGISHERPGQSEKDRKRQKDLEEMGFTVLRFKDWEVLDRPEDVWAELKSWVDRKMSEISSPRPPSKGEI